MIEASKLEGKTMVCLKPCDTYSFNQLIKEHRVDRDKAYIVGVGCKGKLDIEKIKKQGIKGIQSIQGAEITDDAETLTIQTIYGEKTCAYKDGMLERCHVCKGKEHQIYDSNKFYSSQKANVDSFEEKMFHIIRAFHVAGRCTDCGECSRVCPQGIPLHLFNRKFIKDIDELYGEYQAGEDTDSKGPLTNFTFDDAEPSIVTERG